MPDPRVIREKYCITAGGYDELYRDEQVEKYRVVFASHEPRGTLLDIGAGTCLLLEYLYINQRLERIAYYIALDLTPCMLYFCERRVRKLGLGYIVDLVEAEATRLPLRDRSVDEAYAFTVFDLTAEPVRAVREEKRVARRRAVYSLLKRVEAKRRVSLCERYIGETDKDVICEPRSIRGSR